MPRLSRSTWFFIAAVVLTAVQFVTFGVIANFLGSVTRLIIVGILSSFVVLSPYLFIRPAWRRTVWIPLVLIMLVDVTETLYERQFGAFYSCDAITSDIFDPMVIGGAIDLMKQTDWMIVLPTLVALILYCLWRRDILTHRYTARFKWLALAAVVTILSAYLATVVVRMHNERKSLSEQEQFTFVEQLNRGPRLQDFSIEKGVIGTIQYIVRNLSEYLADNVQPLSDVEKTEIKELIRSSCQPIDTAFSSAVSANRGKNLIVIIVESLNNSVIEKNGLYGCAPYLASLAADSGVIYAPRVLCQAGVGWSASGQLMINSGLLPTLEFNFTYRYSVADYPSLSKALGYEESAEFICETKYFYRHGATNKSFGYKHLYYELHGQNTDRDSVMLGYAVATVRDMPQPFLATLTTLRSHQPYKAPQMLYDNDMLTALPESGQSYACKIHDTDEDISLFINDLRASGIYDNTVIAIIGDHVAPHAVMKSPELDDLYVPLIVLNSGITLRYDDVIGQVDVFPTLLDVMGVGDYVIPQTGEPYRGLGRSILSVNPPRGAVDAHGKAFPNDSIDRTRLDQAWRLSERAITSRFFKP